MCGIAGFWGEIAQHCDAKSRLVRMTNTLAHRGPDGQSYWLGPDVAFGHTRLAVIDLAGGTQPMWSCDGRYIVVFNGEIYNYKELKRDLEALGRKFRTHSDTEVIWAAIDAWGIEQGLLKLNGMFAFALYNVRSRRMLLARDRVGIKPLYWARIPGGFIFGSEQKALFASGLVPRRINPVGLHDYLAVGYATMPTTCWADINAVKPGSWIEVGSDGERSGTYWDWSPRETFRGNLGAATDRAQTILRDAFRRQLISDVPLGAFLSGGLDSSLMIALLSGSTNTRTSTFSLGFGDPAYDETRFARQVAERFETDHHEIRVENGDGDPSLFSKIVEQYDEPFGDSSCIPSYLICREMQKHLKVVLSGDGGDEVLGGYPRYVYARRLAAVAQSNRFLPRFRPAMLAAGEKMGRYGCRVAKAFRLAQLPESERLCELQGYFSEEERSDMYQPEFRMLATSEGSTATRFQKFLPSKRVGPVQQFIAAEMRLRLNADYLRKVDTASSAHGIEVRVPYLDSQVLDLAAELPVRFKVGTFGRTKILSRRMADQHLPRGFSNRRKQGFSIPIDHWAGSKMRAFFRDLLLGSDAKLTSLIQRKELDQIWHTFDDRNSGPRLSGYQKYQRLFLVISLELWLRRWSPSLS